METLSNKTIVLQCYRKIIRDLDFSLVDLYIKDDYIQHSPTVKNGREGLVEMLGFLKSLPKPTEQAPSPIVRVIADGDFVAVHLDVKFMAKRMAVIDLYRLENGKLAEHWDVGQMQPAYENVAITMTNGTTVIEDADDAVRNKKLISSFYADAAATGNLINAAQYLSPGFIEHNAAAGLISAPFRETIIHRTIAEGNFVVTHCERKSFDKTFAQFHIFKMEDSKIAEHWSVEQEVPEVMAHENGMF